MDSVLVKFHGKNYYVKYDDLLNKANDKLFAYEDKELTRNAKLNGQTLMFNKKDMEDKLKNDIKMPSRMPSNLATEYNNMSKINEMRSIGKRNIDKLKKIMHSMWAKNYNVTEDEIIEALPVEWWDIWESADAEIRRLVDDFLNKLKHARSIWDESNLKKNKMTNEQKSSTFKIEIINKNGPSTIQTLKVDPKTTELFDIVQRIKKSKNVKDVKILEPEGKTKMTNEQKLRKYIREMIIEALKEGDPYGKPDEDKYLFKTGQDYLAGIQGESISEVEGEAPSAEELAAKQKAAEEKAKKAAYQRFFSQALAKFGYSSVTSIPDEKKKSFYDYIDSAWTSKQEAPKKKVKSEAVPGHSNTDELEEGGTYTYMSRKPFVDADGNKITSGMEFILKSFEVGQFVELENANAKGDTYNVEYDIFLSDFKNSGDWTDPAGGIHSFDDDDPAKMYESGTLNELWKGKLQKNYDDEYEQFLKYDEMYGIADRLGFGSAEEAWEANPTIQVGVNPKDLKVIGETSSTGGVAGYETPAAFTGQKGISKKQKRIANQLGYELVDKSYAVKDQGDTQDLTEGKLNESINDIENIIDSMAKDFLKNTFPGEMYLSKERMVLLNKIKKLLSDFYTETVDKSYAVKDQGDTQDLKEEMSKRTAYQKDLEWAKKNKQNPFYADIEDGTKYIWGTASGFAYSSPIQPQKEVENMWNIMKKELNINEGFNNTEIIKKGITSILFSSTHSIDGIPAIDEGDIYDVVDKIIKFLNENFFNETKLNEGLDSYYLKDENLTPEQKLGVAMRQVRNNLSEIENVVKRSVSLKKENNIGTENLGKRTYSSLKKIHETVTRLMVALNDMR